MSKKELNNEAIEVKDMEEVTETETKETFGSKIKSGAKKHGKKILGIVGAGALAVLAYGLGKKSAGGNDCDEVYEDEIEDGVEDVYFEDVTEE